MRTGGHQSCEKVILSATVHSSKTAFGGDNWQEYEVKEIMSQIKYRKERCESSQSDLAQPQHHDSIF